MMSLLCITFIYLFSMIISVISREHHHHHHHVDEIARSRFLVNLIKGGGSGDDDNESIMRTVSTTVDNYRQRLRSVGGNIIKRPLKHLNMMIITLEGDLDDERYASTLMASIGQLDSVESIARDRMLQLPNVSFTEIDDEHTKDVIPNDQFWDILWGLKDVRAPEAWEVTTGARQDSFRPIVTVIDTGVQFDHPDLINNMWINYAELNGIDGEDDDGNGYVDDYFGWNAIDMNGIPYDDHGHGTHVAGTVGAVGNNAIGVVGVNWSPFIQACKFLDYDGWGWSADAVTCLDYAIATGASLTVNSYGGGDPSESFKAAIEATRDNNMLFIAAAGNDLLNTDETPVYPACYDVDNVINVGALDLEDTLAWFSNYGVESVELLAPGVMIGSTYLGNSYAYGSGTSMSAPHVAGAASLLLSMNSLVSYSTLRDVLLNHTAQYNGTGEVITDGKLDLHEVIQNFILNLEPSVILDSGTLSCSEVCKNSGMYCVDSVMKQVNTDLDYCYAKMVELHPNVEKGSVVDTFLMPEGCFLHLDKFIYVNQVDEEGAGCGARSAPLADTTSKKPCFCV